MEETKTILSDTKKVFRKCGTCSHTFFYLLNRQYGFPKESEENASDLLAGGFMNTGHQCGMLWGASLAIGAESYRRNNISDQAIASAITATQSILKSFSDRTKTVNCREFTHCDLTSRYGMFKLGLKTILGGVVNSPCFNLAKKWAPEAIQAANEGLSQEQTETQSHPLSCASEVAKKMGASDEEMITVAGFAGGLGLSGNACGALSAALWLKILAWCRKNPGKTPPYIKNQDAKNLLNLFYSATDSEILCHKISGQKFKTINEHSEFVKNGGCEKLIKLLAQA